MNTTSRKLRLLLVERDAQAANALAELLRLLGHDPMVARDGVTAARVSSEPIDVALVDIRAVEDASQIAHQLRDNVRLVGLIEGEEDARRFYWQDEGFVSFVRTPVAPSDMERVLEALKLGA